jgi:hypothetical protein
VDQALAAVERILHVSRNPRLAEDVEHSYGNKYDLANMLTNAAIIAQMNALERIGLTAEVLKSIDPSKTTTLRFQASDSCSFLKEQTVSVPMPHQVETVEDTTTTGSFFGSTKKSTITHVTHKVKEFHWKVEVEWQVFLFSGTNLEDKKVLQSRSSSAIVVSQSNNTSPLAKHTTHPPTDLSLAWLLKMIDMPALTAQFKIDTEKDTTKTPLRNTDVKDATDFMNRLAGWTTKMSAFFQNHVERNILSKHNPAGSPPPSQAAQLRSVSAGEVFCPIQPLLEEAETVKIAGGQKESEEEPKSILALVVRGDDTEDSPMLTAKDMNKLLNEQIRTIQEATVTLQKTFPNKQLVKLVSVAEATIVLLCKHVEELGSQYQQSMGYIEHMLTEQLVTAIGKRVEAKDLDQFVKYHNAKLLDPPPQPFCQAIRRPAHYPDGILSIEGDNGDGKMEPIDTLVRQVESSEPLQVPLNAATTLELTGNKYLHGWVQHRFKSSHKSYQLIARARQFSSFILVVGTMVGPNQLEPKDAIIIQNKDEILIPLLLNELPTPKEFKDAIKSLSPEQQRFAKAFRSMQLESSVFGVCVIQMKPQLEALLGLPSDALTKEMQLTQDLMELFVEYQVPSDLLSYDGEHDETVREKVANVKGHVKAVLDVIRESKTKQLEDNVMKADMAVERAVADRPYAFGGAPGGNQSLGSRRRGGGGARVEPERMMMEEYEAPMEMEASMMRSMAAAPKMAAMAAVPKMAKRKLRPAPPPPVSQARVAESSSSISGFRSEVPEADSNICAPTEESTSHKIATPLTSGDGKGDGSIDFTLIPKLVDAIMEKHDTDSALRSTIIKTDTTWTRRRQESFLTEMESKTLRADDIKTEKNKAFDLLDALSRSGSLAIACSELHVIVAVTHCFENDVMGTVIQDNINPIEKLEKSTLLIASTIHGVPAKNVIRDSVEVQRLTNSFPALLGAPAN